MEREDAHDSDRLPSLGRAARSGWTDRDRTSVSPGQIRRRQTDMLTHPGNLTRRRIFRESG